MTKLTEEMVHARTRQSNLSAVSKLNCWGSELQDVSLVKRLPNVEVLSLSVNRIRSLADFQHCKKLQHLFVRKNDIRDLNQVCYLRDLPALSSLWLAENPCAGAPGYRLAVIKALPNLEKLDDVAVSSEERSEAERHGAYLHHPEQDDPFAQSPENDVEPIVAGSPDEDTEEQFGSRPNHYYHSDYGRQYKRNEYSPELSSPAQTSYMRNAGNNYHQDETHQDNGYEGVTCDHADEDFRPQPAYVPTPPSAIVPNHHRSTNKDLMPEDESPPRSIKQEDDHEDLQPRALLTRSRTESLPRLTRLEVDDAEDYTRSGMNTPRCRLDTLPRSLRHDLDDQEISSHRASLTRSRTVDMLGGHHAVSLSSLHERDRPRQKHPDAYIPRSLQQPATRPRNINVLNAVLCLIKELELQDLELVAMSVNCRIDELRV